MNEWVVHIKQKPQIWYWYLNRRISSNISPHGLIPAVSLNRWFWAKTLISMPRFSHLQNEDWIQWISNSPFSSDNVWFYCHKAEYNKMLYSKSGGIVFFSLGPWNIFTGQGWSSQLCVFWIIHLNPCRRWPISVTCLWHLCAIICKRQLMVQSALYMCQKQASGHTHLGPCEYRYL